MDSLFVLAGVLGIGDILLARVWWRERRKRRRAERAANSALRENLKLMDAIERRARAVAPSGPVVVHLPAQPQQIREAIAELKTRQVVETGGAA